MNKYPGKINHSSHKREKTAIVGIVWGNHTLYSITVIPLINFLFPVSIIGTGVSVLCGVMWWTAYWEGAEVLLGVMVVEGLMDLLPGWGVPATWAGMSWRNNVQRMPQNYWAFIAYVYRPTDWFILSSKIGHAGEAYTTWLVMWISLSTNSLVNVGKTCSGVSPFAHILCNSCKSRKDDTSAVAGLILQTEWVWVILW